MKQKLCNKCNITKSVNDFYFRLKNDKRIYNYICKECEKIRTKQYYLDNNQKIKNRTSIFRKNNPNYMKKWRKNNPDKIYAQRINWYNTNKEKINAKERLKRKTNLEYKLKKNLRRRVNQVITRDNKSDTTLVLLGCSVYEFIKHLESKFTEGMNWDNYGKWHIDHIVPCASFDLSDIEQQKLCFHYSNLQPLWAEDNLRKSDKVPDIV